MKKFSIEIKWGVIFIIAQILWIIFEKAMGWHDELIDRHAVYTNFFGIIAVIVYLLALKEKRNKAFGGKMNWQQGFVSGIVLTIIISLLSPINQFITNQFISPEFFDTIVDHSVESGRMSRENAKAYFNLRSYVIQAVFGSLVMGVVTAAVVALLMRKE